MEPYISKSALVEEINRRITAYQKNSDKADNKIARISIDGRIAGLRALLSFLDTLEVKEVDFIEERMKECPYKQVGCTMYDGHILECRGACSRGNVSKRCKRHFDAV